MKVAVEAVAVTEERADIGFFAIDLGRGAGELVSPPLRVLIEGAYLVRNDLHRSPMAPERSTRRAHRTGAAAPAATSRHATQHASLVASAGVVPGRGRHLPVRANHQRAPTPLQCLGCLLPGQAGAIRTGLRVAPATAAPVPALLRSQSARRLCGQSGAAPAATVQGVPWRHWPRLRPADPTAAAPGHRPSPKLNVLDILSFALLAEAGGGWQDAGVRYGWDSKVEEIHAPGCRH